MKNSCRSSSHTVLSQLEENRLGITAVEKKVASQTLSNPSSRGLVAFPADSRDVTITLEPSGY